MVATGAVITHGSNAVRYSVDKELGDLVKTNFLPEDITPSSMWARMVMHQQQFREKLNRHRHLDNTSIRIEISPDKPETENWTLDDWKQLAEDFVREFDAQEIHRPDGRREDCHTHLANTQYVVSLHRDSKGQILHLHINANRVDMEGNVNNAYKIGKRASLAANKINEQRGWIQSMQRREENIEAIRETCIDALKSMDVFNWTVYVAKIRARGYDVKLVRSKEDKVVGYSIRKGNSTYKSSVLGNGRDLMPSKIEKTWAKLHQESAVGADVFSLFGGGEADYSYAPTKSKTAQQNKRVNVQRKKEEPTKRIERQQVKNEQMKQQEPIARPQPVMVHHDINVKGTNYSVDIPEVVNDIIMKESELPEEVLWTKIEDVQHTAMLLFLNYIDAATTLADDCGGGSNTPDSGWGRKDDEDDREWARRCAHQAGIMHVYQRRRGIGR